MAEGGGLFSSVEEGWEGFLDWSEDRGLSLRSITDALEEKGIPSLPAFLLLLLALAVGAWFFLAPIVFGPQTGEIQVVLNDEEGKPIQGALVKISSAAGSPSYSPVTDYTDAEGKVSFRNVKAEAAVVSASYAGYSDAQRQVQVEAGKARPVLLSSSRLQQKTVGVNLGISGPTDSLKTKTELQDEYYNTIEEKTGLNPSFSVKQGQVFSVRVTSPGFGEQYLANQKAGQEGDKFLAIELKPVAAKRPAKVHVLVIGRDRKPIANASVQLMHATTEAMLANLTTGEDGRTQAAEMDVGTQFKAAASKEGFQTTASALVNAEEDSRVEVVLRSLEDAEKLFVEVRDAEGKSIDSPAIRLYQKTGENYSLSAEQKALDGKAEFKLEKMREYLLTAWAAGYLPKTIASVKPGTRTVQLAKGTAGNSAKLRVHAKNFDASDAQATSIALRAGDGSPIGFPEKITGTDGVQIFDAVPLGPGLVLAEGKGRKGSVRVELAKGEQSVEIILQRALGKVRATATDSFSKQPIANALVSVQGFNQSSCRTGEKGECTIEALEFAGATATISAPGYEDYLASSFTITPNADYNLETQLFPLSVRATTKLSFIGFFDAKGNKLTELSPASEYRGRFLLRSPTVAFSAAQAFISIGKRSDALDRGSAVITSYEAAGSAAAFAGTGFELAASLPIEQNSTLPLASNAPAAAVPGVGEHKWVQFEYGKFAGTREISVGVGTKPVEKGTLELHYRTAFATTGDRVVRNPEDADAGKSKSDLLANDFFETIAIGFEGQCDRNACVQLYFEDAAGKRPLAGYEAELGSEFKLVFNAFAGSNDALEANLETSSIALGVLKGESGTSQAQPQVDAATGSQSVKLTVSGGGGGFFALRGQRLSNAAALKFTLKKKDATAFEKTAYVRLVSQGTPLLRVATSPRSLIAIQPSPVEFTVTDTLGLPVKGARITIGGVDDVIGRPIEAIERENGKYVAEQVVAQGVGSARYTIEASGFATLRSSLQANANKLLELKQQKLELSVRSRNEVVRGEFGASNLVENELAASLFIVKEGTPEILELAVEPTTARVGRRATLNGLLSASIAEYVLGIAEKQRNLNETIIGRVIITARTGATRQTLELPFVATASLSQLPIDSAWETDKDKLEFALSAPKELTQTLNLAVTNNAPHPLLLNQQLNGRGVRVSPLSLEVQPGETGVFKLTASKSTTLSGGCVFEQASTTGEINLYASFQGIKSKKTLPVSISLSASGSCLPNSPQQLSLPLAMRGELPAGTKVRKNEDGSYAALLPDNSVVGFSQAAVLNGNEVSLPATENLVLDGKLVSVSSNGKTRSFSLPFEAVLSIPTGIPVIRRGENFQAILGDSQLSFPASVLFADTKNERQAAVPAGSRMEFTRLPSLDATANPEVTLPATIVFRFPANSLLRTAEDNSPTLQLATGELFDFSLEALLQKQERDGSAIISAAAGTKLLVPPQFYRKLSNNGFSFQLPFPVEVEVPSDTEVVQRRESVAAFLQDYDLLLPSTARFAPTKSGKTASLAASSLVEFHLIDASALSKNNFYSLPIDLFLAIPASARVDETTVSKTVALDGGAILGLPAESTLAQKQVDGSRIAHVPAGSQLSAPPAFVQPLPRRGFRLSLPFSYTVGVQPGTKIIEQGQASKLAILGEYDVLLPASVSFTQKESLLVSSAIRQGQTITITPPPDILLSNNVRVLLPFDLELKLPAEARVKKLSDTTGVFLPGNRPLGIKQVATEGNFSVGRAPSGTALALPPEMVAVATNSTTKMILSLEATLFFEDTTQILRGTSEIEVVGNGYKAFIPSSARLAKSETGATSAVVQPGLAITVQASDFDVLAEEHALPLEIVIRIPENGFVKKRDDGRNYFESGQARIVFGAGSTVEQGVVSAPQNTPIKFSPGLFGPVRIPGLPASTARPRNYRMNLPVPYSFTLPANAQLVDTLQGKALVLGDAVVVFPASGRVTDAGTSKTMEVPANAATLFLAFFPGILDKLNSNIEIFGSADARAAALSKNNKIVVVPVKLEIIAPPEVNATQVSGGTALFLSQSEVIILQATLPLQLTGTNDKKAELQSIEFQSTAPSPAFKTPQAGLPTGPQSGLPAGPQTIAVEANNQISLPPQDASVGQDGVVSFKIPLHVALTIPADAEVLVENSSLIIGLQNPAVDIVLPASVQATQSGGEQIVRLPPDTRVELRPSPLQATQGILVRLPVDVEVLLPPGTRTAVRGSATSVRFPDGSTAEFQSIPEVGVLGVQGVPGAQASQALPAGSRLGANQNNSAIAAGSATKLLRWQAGTNAQLASSAAQGDQNGNFKVTLPVPVNVILPQDAKLSRRGFGILAIIQGGTRVELPKNARLGPSSAGGISASLPAKTQFTTGPFFLDINGPSVTMPFDVSLTIPDDALVNDFAAGGVVVEFAGGARAKFSTGSLSSGAGFGGLGGFGGGLGGFGGANAFASNNFGSSGFGASSFAQPIFVAGFGSGGALNPFMSNSGTPQQPFGGFGGFGAFGLGSTTPGAGNFGAGGQAGTPFATNAIATTRPGTFGGGQGSILSPRFSPIVTSPGLAVGGFGAPGLGSAGLNSFGTLGAQSTLQSLALPVAWIASMSSDYPPIRNPDGSFSFFSQNVEARFPAGSSIISGGVGGFGGTGAFGSAGAFGANPFNQFNNFAGVSGFNGGGTFSVLVPAFGRVSAAPSFGGPFGAQAPLGFGGNPFGGLSGQSIAFPFDLSLQGASVFPAGASGSQLINWPGGSLQLAQPLSSSAFGGGTSNFGRAGLLPGGTGGGPVPVPNLLIPAGTSMIFSQGILQPLPLDEFPEKQQFQQSKDTGQRGMRVGITTPHELQFLGNLPVFSNADGTFNVQTEKQQIRVPHDLQGTQSKPIAFIQRGEHFDMIPLGLSSNAAGNAISLPVDSDFSAAGLKMQKIEGQQTRLDAGSGKFIDFPPQVDAGTASVKVSAGTSFKPSPAISTITSPIEWRLTAPTIITLILKSDAQFIESEGRQAIPAGEANLFLPRGVTPLKAGERLIVTVPAGSTLEMKPLSKTGVGTRGAYDSQTTPITLPLDISFSTLNAAVLPPTQDGRFAVKFRESDVIVFNPGTKHDKLAGTVAVRAGETFFPSNNLLPLPPLPTDRGSDSFLLPSEIQRLRFITPATASLATKPDHKITKESGALVVRTQFEEVRVPGTSSQAGNQIVLSTNDVIEVGPLDYAITDLRQVGIPLTSFFKLPGRARITEDPYGKVKVARLPGRVKIGFSSRAKVTEKIGGEKLVEVAGDDKIFVSRSSLRPIAGNGFELRLPIEWGVVTEANSAIVERGDGSWALRVPGRSGLNTIVLPFKPEPTRRPINFAGEDTVRPEPTRRPINFAGKGTFSPAAENEIGFAALTSTVFLQDPDQPGDSQTQSNAPSFLTDAANPTSLVTRQKSFPAAFVEIPSRTRVQIISVRGDLIDRAQGPVGDAETELALDDELYETFLAVPPDSEVTQNGFSATLTHVRCQEGLAVKAKNRINKKTTEVLKLPQHVQVTATQAEVTGDEQGGQVMRLKKGSKISLKTCKPDDEKSRTFTQIYPGRVKYTLPESAIWEQTQEVDKASFPDCADVIVKNGVVSTIKKVEKIVFRKGASYLKGGPGKQGVQSIVEVPASTPVDVVVCTKPGSGGSVEIEGNPNLIKFERLDGTEIKAGDSLKVTLDSTGVKYETVCVKNIGSSEFYAEANAVEEGVKEFTDYTKIVWNNEKGPRPQRIAPQAEKCKDYSYIPFKVPEGSAYLDGRECIKRGLPTVTDYIQYSTGSTETGAKKATAALKVEITLAASPDKCRAKVAELGFHRTNGFHATYAYSIEETGLSPQAIEQQMTFKNSGHTRYFQLVNNRQESVRVNAVNEPDNNRAAECTLENGNTLAKEEFEMKPGEVKLVKCVSNPAKEGAPLSTDLKITAVPLEETRRITGITTRVLVKLKAFKPVKENNAFYSASPWGVLAGAEDTSALSRSFGGLKLEPGATNTQVVANTPATTPAAQPATPAVNPQAPQPAIQPKPVEIHVPGDSHPVHHSTAGKVGLQEFGEKQAQNIQASFASVHLEGEGGNPFSGGPPKNDKPAPTYVDVAAASLCEEYYCNKTQVLAGATALATAGRLIVEGVAGSKDDELGKRIGEFVEKNGGKNEFTKSIVFQKAGTEKMKPEEFEQAVRAAFAGSEWAPQVITLSSAQIIEGCGIYSLRMTVKLPTGSLYSGRKDFRNKVNFVPEITQLATCDENLFNAALLLGQPNEQLIDGKNVILNPQVAMGRRAAYWPQELGRVTSAPERFFEAWSDKEFDSTFEKWLERLLPTTGLVSTGPYGEEADTRDAESAQAIYKALFRSDLQADKRIFTAIEYNDGQYCLGRASEQLLSISGGATGAAVVTGALAPFTGGASAVLTGISARLATSAGSAIISCGLGGAGGVVGGAIAENTRGNLAVSSVTCDATNACIATAIIGGIMGLVGPGAPAAGGQAAQALARERVGIIRSFRQSFAQSGRTTWNSIKDPFRRTTVETLDLGEGSTATITTRKSLLATPAVGAAALGAVAGAASAYDYVTPIMPLAYVTTKTGVKAAPIVRDVLRGASLYTGLALASEGNEPSLLTQSEIRPLSDNARTIERQLFAEGILRKDTVFGQLTAQEFAYQLGKIKDAGQPLTYSNIEAAIEEAVRENPMIAKFDPEATVGKKLATMNNPSLANLATEIETSLKAAPAIPAAAAAQPVVTNQPAVQSAQQRAATAQQEAASAAKKKVLTRPPRETAPTEFAETLAKEKYIVDAKTGKEIANDVWNIMPKGQKTINPPDDVIETAFKNAILKKEGAMIADQAPLLGKKGISLAEAVLTGEKKTILQKAIAIAKSAATSAAGAVASTGTTIRDTTAAIKNTKTSKLFTTLGGGYLQALFLVLFNPDVRPVRAEFNQQSGVAVFHHAEEPGGFLKYAGNIGSLGVRPLLRRYYFGKTWPTLREVCEADNSGGECVEKTRYLVDSSCKPEKGFIACASLISSKEGYSRPVVLATVNELVPPEAQPQGTTTASPQVSRMKVVTVGQVGKTSKSKKTVQPIDYSAFAGEFFQSVFDPNTPPIDATHGSIGAHAIKKA